MIGLRALALSAAVTAAVCPPLTRALLAQGRMDEPNHRSSHTTPTPRGGGLACAAGIAVTAAASALARHSVAWPALAGAGALAAVGYADDRAGLGPVPRLAAQAAIGAVVGGLTSGTLKGALAGSVLMPPIVNATNFMDGINGISGLTAAVWGLNACAAGGRTGAAELVGLGAMTAGAALGFLPSNVPTARLFLGDVGSYLLGGLFAGGVITARDHRGRLLVGAPLTVYLADTATTLVRRGVRGERLTEAHREHAYQRLVSSCGLSHVQSSTVAAGAAGLVGGVEWLPVPVLGRRTAQTALLAGYLALPDLLAGREPHDVRPGPARAEQAVAA